MNLSEKIQKCKEWIKNNEKDVFLAFLIILTAFLSFGLGRLSKIFDNKTPVLVENAVSSEQKNDGEKIDVSLAEKISNNSAAFLETEKNKNDFGEKIFVASKNGTKYYFLWCKGAEKIKEENKIWFKTAEAAKSKGFEPAKGCKGMQ